MTDINDLPHEVIQILADTQNFLLYELGDPVALLESINELFKPVDEPITDNVIQLADYRK